MVGAAPGLMFNMVLATGILIGTAVLLVIVSFAWYRKEEKKRLGVTAFRPNSGGGTLSDLP